VTCPVIVDGVSHRVATRKIGARARRIDDECCRSCAPAAISAADAVGAHRHDTWPKVDASVFQRLGYIDCRRRRGFTILIPLRARGSSLRCSPACAGAPVCLLFLSLAQSRKSHIDVQKAPRRVTAMPLSLFLTTPLKGRRLSDGKFCCAFMARPSVLPHDGAYGRNAAGIWLLAIWNTLAPQLW
jgi:hypothetical protein